MTPRMSVIDVDLECGVLISSTSYSGFCKNLVQLIAWAEDTYIGLTLRFLIVSLTLSSLFSPSDENLQLEALGEEFELAGSIWWGEYIRPWVLGHWDALALWGQWLFANLICLRVCVMRCFGIVRTIPTSSSSWSTDQTFDLGLCFLLRQRMSLFFDNFDHRLQGQHCPSATLLYIVDWLVQWSKDYSDTTVFGWPTLRMSNRMSYFYIEVWSCEMLSLCGKLIWRWNVVFRLHFVFRRRLYRIPYVNHFVLEKRRLHERYSVASWLFTFEWESVCFENFWKCFDLSEFT